VNIPVCLHELKLKYLLGHRIKTPTVTVRLITECYYHYDIDYES